MFVPSFGIIIAMLGLIFVLSVALFGQLVSNERLKRQIRTMDRSREITKLTRRSENK